MRIVVTGRHGQVARSLAERAAGRPGVALVPLGRPGLDLADPASVARAVAEARPDIVVSAAAYTAVDKAEDEPDLAFAVNAAGAGAVAEAAARAGAPVVHLSTDYVFSGDKSGAYVETDPTGPKGVYGRSKLAGEARVAAANARHFVLRTAWVYSPFGRNFVKTMLTFAETRGVLHIVADQFGSPTSALDVADAVLALAGRLAADRDAVAPGIYHLAGAGRVNWSGLAAFALAESAARGGPSARVTEIGTADYPTRAARPANSELSSAKFEAAVGFSMPPWRDSCAAVVARLLAGA